MTETFKGPARYAVYGRMTEDGQTARISGCNTIDEAKRLIALHQKSFPGCACSVWEATWKEVKL